QYTYVGSVDGGGFYPDQNFVSFWLRIGQFAQSQVFWGAVVVSDSGDHIGKREGRMVMLRADVLLGCKRLIHNKEVSS
ncbi:MAG: hypothetical protein MUE75_10195, partial [Algoriphagus sp.]|nr:hypothetical protein [Algoriphagus sp.]